MRHRQQENLRTRRFFIGKIWIPAGGSVTAHAETFQAVKPLALFIYDPERAGGLVEAFSVCGIKQLVNGPVPFEVCSPELEGFRGDFHAAAPGGEIEVTLTTTRHPGALVLAYVDALVAFRAGE